MSDAQAQLVLSTQVRLDSEEYNSKARALNSLVTRSDCILRPLKHTTTHQVVDLPRTLEDFHTPPDHLLCVFPPSSQYLILIQSVMSSVASGHCVKCLMHGLTKEDFIQLKEFIGVGVWAVA
ncbi:hypothetical protein F4782DRAFT_495591 [Xylaria castorea]|nr:hypothetical protein F4782DRAFT_495591 [Xylaria castorea]